MTRCDGEGESLVPKKFSLSLYSGASDPAPTLAHHPNPWDPNVVHGLGQRAQGQAKPPTPERAAATWATGGPEAPYGLFRPPAGAEEPPRPQKKGGGDPLHRRAASHCH